MYPLIEDPEIGWIQRTGYPSWMQPKRDLDVDDDEIEYDYEEDLDGYCDEE